MALSASDSLKGDTGEVSPESDDLGEVGVMENYHIYQDEPPVSTTEALNSEQQQFQQTVNISRLCQPCLYVHVLKL